MSNLETLPMLSPSLSCSITTHERRKDKNGENYTKPSGDGDGFSLSLSLPLGLVNGFYIGHRDKRYTVTVFSVFPSHRPRLHS